MSHLGAFVEAINLVALVILLKGIKGYPSHLSALCSTFEPIFRTLVVEPQASLKIRLSTILVPVKMLP